MDFNEMRGEGVEVETEDEQAPGVRVVPNVEDNRILTQSVGRDGGTGRFWPRLLAGVFEPVPHLLSGVSVCPRARQSRRRLRTVSRVSRSRGRPSAARWVEASGGRYKRIEHDIGEPVLAG